MTITLALETSEAREAVAAARGAGDRLVLVPRLGRSDGPDPSSGRFARVGTISTIERSGALPGGTPAVVVTGNQRATVGAATSVAGAALWINVEPVEDQPADPELAEQVRELRAVFEAIGEHRGISRLGDLLRNVSEPGQLADVAGYWPELSVERKVELLETLDPAKRVELVIGGAARRWPSSS